MCETKWALAMAYFRQQHLVRFGPGPTAAGEGSSPSASGASGGGAEGGSRVGAGADEEDTASIMRIYCQILAERGESE